MVDKYNPPLPGEISKHYNLFLKYRSMPGVRRISDLDWGNLKLFSIYQLSAKYKWNERCQEYDAQKAIEAEQSNSKLKNEILENKLQLYNALFQKTLHRLETLDESKIGAVALNNFIQSLDKLEEKLADVITEKESKSTEEEQIIFLEEKN